MMPNPSDDRRVRPSAPTPASIANLTARFSRLTVLDWRTLRDAGLTYHHPIFDFITRIGRGFAARLRVQRLRKIRARTDQVFNTRKRLRDQMSRTASNRRIHPGRYDHGLIGDSTWFRPMDGLAGGAFTRPGNAALARV